MTSFVTEIGLDFLEFKESGVNIISVLANSNEFSKVFSIISNNEDLHRVDNQVVTEDSTSFTYTNGYFNITLTADYSKDIYKVLVGER